MTGSLPPAISVVVASRNRPADLRRCLLGLGQLYYRNLEVVVVADAASLDGIETVPGLRTLAYDEANLAAARNAGIDAAGGEIVAFIDDDAVPEPTWLDHLAAPLADDRVSAAGGYVIGRNGISLQWGALCLDRDGTSHPLDLDGDETAIFTTAPGARAIRTQGTNMAVRRSVLADLGGFDEAYRWYHEDADLNMRLALDGHLTAVVPKARVHHAYSPSERRRSDRAPLSLYDIGASSAVFHRKYLAPGDWAAAREALAASQHRRLTEMLIDGRLEPKDFERLGASLLEGYDEGLLREPRPGTIRRSTDFVPRPEPAAPRHLVLAGGRLDRAEMRSSARDAVASGAVATVIALDPTARYHHVRFTKGGWWEQTGGRFGRSGREGPLFTWWDLSGRLAAEARSAAIHRTPPGRA